MSETGNIAAKWHRKLPKKSPKKSQNVKNFQTCMKQNSVSVSSVLYGFLLQKNRPAVTETLPNLARK